jgi:hypothetical protein
MAFTLISTNRIASAGLAILFKGRMCKILSKGPNWQVIAEIPQVEGLYSVASQHREHANVAKVKLTVCEAHRILGHVSQAAMKQMVQEGLIDGLDVDTSSRPEFCDACTKAKATCQLFPGETKNRALTYGELIHTDLWGPLQTTSLGGCSYYISFMDDYSHETKVQFLKLKSEALTAFKHYEAHLSHQHPSARITKVRSDRGGEYLSAEFDKYLRDQGIE